MPPASDADHSAPDPCSRDLVLVADTGGTKTAAWLAALLPDKSHQILGQARTSAGNPLSVGFEKATRAIHDALSQARDSAEHVGNGRVPQAILSIAGAANRDMTRRFVTWAQEVRFAHRVAIVSDVLPILAAGTPDCCGVALIAGTGSSAFGRAQGGAIKRCGGWGYLLGDEGSGYALGRAALQLALRSLEAGIVSDSLATAVIDKLAAKTVTELTRAIYGSGDPRHAIAALAPLVCAAAENGNSHANEFLSAAANDLAELAARAATAVGVADSGFPLAISGGLLMHSAVLQEKLRSELIRRGLDCEINIVREPLVGCVRLADPKFASLVNWHDCN
jgi:N-acetylglucosamine kinase-like BadF-type ATPase